MADVTHAMRMGLATALETSQARVSSWAKHAQDTAGVLRFLQGRLLFVSRPTDIFVSSYPRSGTTWTQCILHVLLHGPQFAFRHISNVQPWFERSLALGTKSADDYDRLPSPRVFKSHLPRKWLPREGRFIYVEREGRDVLVSYHRFYETHLGYRGTFEAFQERFLRGQLQYGSWFKHVEGWRRVCEQANVFWLKYEALASNLRVTVRNLASFLDVPLSEERLAEVLEFASFERMKSMETKFDPITEHLIDRGLVSSAFLRKGRVGDSKACLSPEQHERFEKMRQSHHLLPEWEFRLAEFLH